MVAAAPCASWRSFRDSLKVLVADIEHATALASEYWRDYDRACLQMRMSYSPAVRIFLFLMQWTNCSLADAVYVDDTTTMCTHERKASIMELYGKRSVDN